MARAHLAVVLAVVTAASAQIFVGCGSENAAAPGVDAGGPGPSNDGSPPGSGDSGRDAPPPTPPADGGPDASAPDGAPLPGDAGDGGDAAVAAGDPAVAPVITGITPAAGPRSTAQTLLVRGTGFATGAEVFFDGTSLATTFVSGAALSAAVPVALTNAAGAHAVYVENTPGTASTRSGPAVYTVAADPTAPTLVDFDPDTALPGATIDVYGTNLTGALTFKDVAGTAATGGTLGTGSWIGVTMDRVELTIPANWVSGPISVTNALGAFRGPVLNIGENLTRTEATMSASTQYTNYEAGNAKDGDLTTSWFAEPTNCVNGTNCTGVAPWISADFAAAQTVGRVSLRGNRESPDGFDLLRVRIELRDANGAPLLTAIRALPDAARNVDLVVTPPIAGVRAVRVTGLDDQGQGPGLAEIEIFAN